jgi:hypothetical protein
MNYEEYVRAFNSGDDEALVRQYFTEDTRFIGGTRTLVGAQEFLKFLNFAHDGVREIIRAQTVLQRGAQIFAEIDMDFYASKDRPEFPLKPLKKGDMTTVKFFVLYTIRDSRIAELKAMTWPADYGVTKPSVVPSTPFLGGEHQQRLAFRAYLDAFSAGQIEKFTGYYQPNVTLKLGSGKLLSGREAIAGFYRNMFSKVREQLTLHRLVADQDGLAADLTTTFTAHQDMPDFPIAAIRKGQAIRGRVFVYYTLQEGLVANIEVARAGPMSEPMPSGQLEPI